jgi:YggT family protein
VSNAIFQATNWLVLPLRRILPSARRVDVASLVAVLLAAIVYVVAMVAIAGVDPLSFAPVIALVAVLSVIKWALNLIIWLTIIMALLSWLNPHSPAMPILYQLTAPFLNPLRRVIPNLGGIDLSPILLFVIVQVLLMVVTRAAVQLTLFGI